MSDYNQLKLICLNILEKINNNLGSTNIKNTFYSPHLDKYIVNEGIISKKRNYTIDALTYENINEIKTEKLSLMRNIIRNYMNEQNFQGMNTEHKRFFLRNKIRFLSEKYGLGNCEELATQAFFMWCINYSEIYNDVCLAFFKVSENYYNTSLKPEEIDHIFVIVGHNEYGDNSIIIDPWLNQIFTLKEFKTKMKYNIFNVPSMDIEIRKKFSIKDFVI
ncbi:hypothetical protein EDC55_10921 [Allofrancisella inopinata]|uniref:Uncharacterized protein n=1 Tax=Allofrancisella inopinata TaxID=1085647 RepID=A0AAE6YJY8_9GAMM|nr:hypothetical protein [Allofrancisella inopinata]QIV96147.1 hypothetical protein E4K63_04605 [Allofrancisella inopinata]TDT72061.1 hypothetical protein EDC55_10921 [Allofrancisella inopinata]